MPTYSIHPAIGIARLGNSPTRFYLAPEREGSLPIACDADGHTTLKDGKEVPISNADFRDDEGRIARQGARFRVYETADDGTAREVAIGDTITVRNAQSGQIVQGTLTDITWTAWLANKKAAWYEFKELEGEHGYAPDHPLRNAQVTGDAARRALFIDPGPRSVSKGQTATFSRSTPATAGSDSANYGPQSFPPPLSPASIDTLGELRHTVQPVTTGGVTRQYCRLVVLGGFGNSGSTSTPRIESFANNDGWFDDEADGYVTAAFSLSNVTIDGKPPVVSGTTATLPVPGSSWCLVGYPRYAPQFVDMVTMNDTLFDVFVRTMAYEPEIYGVPPFDAASNQPKGAQALADWRTRARWNQDYHPRFWRDIWPILQRPDRYGNMMDKDPFVGGQPHGTAPRMNFDPAVLSAPPLVGEDPETLAMRAAARHKLYDVLRKPGQENLWQLPPNAQGRRPLGMPLLAGDNPITNTLVSKFHVLTDTMLFLLGQWADGKFIDEKREGFPIEPADGPTTLDRGVLSNVMGGSFCPGAETTWIIRNPSVYASPYRVKQAPATPGALSLTDDLSVGMEPGDMTKRNAVPWQADFNECSTQTIDTTYEEWNVLYPGSIGEDIKQRQTVVYWWPTHRPMYINGVMWSGAIPTDTTGDLAMVTAWADMGFVVETATGGVKIVGGWNPDTT